MLARLWLRPLWQRPRRALATVLGVAVGVASVVATGLASRAAVASMTDDVEALAGEATLEVTRPGGLPVADMGLLAPLAAEVRVIPVVEGVALVPARGELVRLLGIDALGSDGPGALSAETAHRFLLGQGAVLAAGAARRLGLAAGERLALVVGARRVELEVLALFEPRRLASAFENVVLLDVALAQELLGRRELVDRLELVPRLALDEAALAARAQALLPPGTLVARASERRTEGERLVRSLAFNLTALAGVSVLVATVLVATTLATSVVQRRPMIALLRSLGASRTQLAAAVLLEAGATGLAGGVLGVGLGRAGAERIAERVHGSFATLDEDLLLGAVRLEPGWALAGLAAGTLCALAAALLALREAWRTPPLQHLRRTPEESRPRPVRRALAGSALVALALLAARLPPWDGRPVGTLLASLAWLAVGLVLAGPWIDAGARFPTAWLGLAAGTPIRLAQAALAAARARAAWAASAVGVAVALSVAMTTMVSSFRANVVDWTDQALRSDLYLRPLSNARGTSAGRIDPEAVAIARRLFGAERVDAYHESSASVDGARVLLGGADLGVAARENGVPFLDGRPSSAVFGAALARGTVLVNESFARRLGLGRGDRVRLTAARGSAEREIEGVYRDFSGHVGRVVLGREDFLALAGDEGAHNAAVFLPPSADVAAERERLRAALGTRFELEILDNRELRAEVLRLFERTFAITVALQAVAALVAALAVVLVLTALVHERARELAVVRVLGGSRLQLAGLVAGQALVLGLAGSAIGLSVGLVVGYVLVTVLNVQSFGWSLRFTLPPAVLWSVAAVVPACLAASWIPAWLSLRLEPSATLREPD
jgi:putative ABC transport system permease protein